MKSILILEGLNCAHCAEKIESKVRKIDKIENVEFDFMSKKLCYEVDENEQERIKAEIVKIVKATEPDVEVVEKKELKEYELFLKDLDCANCASKIETKIKELKDVEKVTVDFMSTTCKYECDTTVHKQVEEKIIQIVKEIEPDVEVLVKKNKKTVTKKDNKDIIQIAIGTTLLILGIMTEQIEMVSTILTLAAYLVLGYPILLRAFKNILKGKVFDENFLMSLATLCALFLGKYKEAVEVMLFYQVGESFQERAVFSSRQSIADLMDIRPDVATVIKDGKESIVAAEDIRIGDILLIKPGERVALDGIVVKGISSLDTSSLTGESLERDVEIGNEVLSGCVNRSGVLEIEVSKEFKDSTVSKILELVENTSSKKAKSEQFITKFAKVYTPIVVLLAACLAIGLPLFDSSITMYESLYRASTFLVISCPCALVISIPLGFFAGIGGLSKNGILVKGSTVIETLSTLKQIVFDKTGTLTKGEFGVSKIIGNKECLELATYAESNSTHPIATSIVKAYEKVIDKSRITNNQELAGHGIKISLDDDDILVGNAKLMKHEHVEIPLIDEVGTLIYVAKNKNYIGTIIILDQIKEDSKEAINKLKQIGINDCTMLTGDAKAVALKIAKEVNIDHVYSECLPQQKVEIVEQLLPKGKLGFVGDGINDAPVLALADIGFAMGGVGSDAAIEAADVVIMDDHLTKVALSIAKAKKTMKIVHQNIVGAIGIKIIVLISGAMGITNMQLAIFADVGVSVIAILNSIRLLKK